MKDSFLKWYLSWSKIKKYSIKYTMSIKISLMHYMKWTRVMLTVVFVEFKLICISFFCYFISFHHHYQLVKGQLQQKSGELHSPITSDLPGFYGPHCYFIIVTYLDFFVEYLHAIYLILDRLLITDLFSNTDICDILIKQYMSRK